MCPFCYTYGVDKEYKKKQLSSCVDFCDYWFIYSYDIWYRNYLFFFFFYSFLSSYLIYIGVSWTKVKSLFIGSSGWSGYM